MVFPSGIRYNRELDTYRTFRVNTIFNDISRLQRDTGGNKKRTNSKNMNLSFSVAGTGLEPMTFGL